MASVVAVSKEPPNSFERWLLKWVALAGHKAVTAQFQVHNRRLRDTLYVTPEQECEFAKSAPGSKIWLGNA